MRLIIDATKNNNHYRNGNFNVNDNNTINRRTKGTHAFITECRRIVWEYIIWPIIVKTRKPYFTRKEYHLRRDEFISAHSIHVWDLGCGLSSLISKGILHKKIETSIGFTIDLIHIYTQIQFWIMGLL
jgi:hypothetical protein